MKNSLTKNKKQQKKLIDRVEEERLIKLMKNEARLLEKQFMYSIEN